MKKPLYKLITKDRPYINKPEPAFGLWSCFFWGILLGFIALSFIGCSAPTSNEAATAKPETYPPTLPHSCIFTTVKNDTLMQDSLQIGSKKYTISSRSRYRALGDNEYLDTKTDSLYIIYPCEGK
jgi:hypothetical protein